jgi:5,10-methylenetetrahydromethanopterin reductase
VEISFGIEFLANETAEKLADLVKFSEDNGLQYAWITDHYNNRDSYSLLTYIAAKTSKIKIGPGVTNPYTRTAPQLASAIATVNEVSNGRAVFGIGPGDKVTFDGLGIDWVKPLTTVRETVEIVRKLLTGKKVSYEGQVCNIKSAKMNFVKEVTIPVYIGAQGPNMLRLAGELGEGALVNGSHPRDFETAVKLIKEGTDKAGKNFADFDVAAYTSFSIADTKEEAEKAAKPVTAFIVAGSPDAVFEKHGIPIEDVNKVRDGFKESFGAAIKAVTPEMLESFAICGAPNECIDKIDTLIKAGVTQVIPGSPLGPDKIKSIELIGTKIIPHFIK